MPFYSSQDLCPALENLSGCPPVRLSIFIGTLIFSSPVEYLADIAAQSLEHPHLPVFDSKAH